jgi:alpha-L-fucosidase
MTVPSPGMKLRIKSLGMDAKYWSQRVKTVKLLGYGGELQWKQEKSGLAITYPDEMPFETSIVFKVE